MTIEAQADPHEHVVTETIGHLQALHRLTAATVAATSVESIYDAALEVLNSSTAADRSAILLFDDGVMRFKAWRGLSDPYRSAVEGHSPWPPGTLAPEPIVMADVAAAHDLGALRVAVLAEGIRSLAFVPLLDGTRLLGKFMLYCDRPHDFGPDELALARTVGGHIAFALEKHRLEEELRSVADKLAATLNAVSEGITVQAPDGSLLLANDAAAALVGLESAAALVAATPSELVARFTLADERGEPLALDRLPGRAALRGEQPDEVLVRWRTTDGGQERCSLVRARPVFDDGGQVRFAVNVFRDVTERQQALEALRISEARLAFLASASRRLLSTALDPDRVLAQVSELVVPELADWCAVRELGADGEMHRVQVVAARQADVVARLEAYGDPLRGHPVLDALLAGQSMLVREMEPSMLGLAHDAEHRQLLTDLDVRSAMLVPLRHRGRTLGVLTLAVGSGRSAYTEADLALAEEFGARVAATIDNAQSFATEHATAATLATALLPGRLPQIPGLALAARYRAAGDVGGDFYDCFPLGDGTWMLVVGDVCGRGIQAASMTGMTRHTVRAAALHASSPAAVLADLNRVLLDATEEENAAWLSKTPGGDSSFCTVCLTAVRPCGSGAQVTVSAAGHPLPLVVRHDGQVAEVGVPGSLVGVVAALDVSEQTVELGPGDALVLYTDGITERRVAGRLFEDELVSVLRAGAGLEAAELATRIEEAAVAFAPSEPDDDMAVLVLAVPAMPSCR